MDILLLRLDAPLMSFGAPIIDRFGTIQPYPTLSMLTGLLSNALGYDHWQYDLLQRLQERLHYACRQDHPGTRVSDYQTVDLGQPCMEDNRAWTTHGALSKRKGGPASSGTHIRYRDYWADAIYTLAVTLIPPNEAPAIDNLADALEHPARPLFIGRKPCLPSVPILLGCTRADNILDPLQNLEWADKQGKYYGWWPSDTVPHKVKAEHQPVTDARDWTNQIHIGERWIASGTISVGPTKGHQHGNA